MWLLSSLLDAKNVEVSSIGKEILNSHNLITGSVKFKKHPTNNTKFESCKKHDFNDLNEKLVELSKNETSGCLLLKIKRKKRTSIEERINYLL